MMSDAVKADENYVTCFLVLSKSSVNASFFHSLRKLLQIDWLWYKATYQTTYN